MAEIIQSLLGGQAIRLYNEQFGRRMTIGCQWGKIRILVRFTTQATSNINNSGLVVGVSQGTTDMFRSSNTTDFVGAHLGPTLQASTFTYNGASPPFASVGGFSTLAFRRIGNTNTSIAPGGSTTTYQSVSPSRGIFGCDIEKANSVMKVRPMGVGTQALAQTDYNFGNLMFNADNDLATIPLIGHSPNLLNVPYSGNYAFDSVNIDWNNGIQPIDIFDILVIRFF